MPVINLRKYYPFLREDRFVDVTDEVAQVFLLADRQENNYRLRAYRHKAYYSLDRGDGIENGPVAKQPGKRSRSNHTQRYWLPRLFALEFSCEKKSKALRA